MQGDLWYWLWLVLITVGMLLINFLYSWLIVKTKIYRPDLDLEARASQQLWEKESASKIATSMMYLFFYAVVVAPILEELVFRNWILGTTIDYWGLWAAVIISAGIWAVLHVWHAMPIIFPMGLIFAYIWLTYGLVWCIVIHAINNVISVFGNLYSEAKRISSEPRATIVTFE